MNSRMFYPPIHDPANEPGHAGSSREAMIGTIAKQLETMAHALAGEVDPLIVAEFILLSNRLEKILEREAVIAPPTAA